MTPAPALTRGRAALWAACACVAGVARYAPVHDRPWDNSVASVNGATYAAEIDEHWRRYGFAAQRGRPLLFALPTTPPYFEAYTNHPPLAWWAMHGAALRLGPGESGLRAVPVAASAALAGLLVYVLARRRGAVAALAGVGVFAACPMSVLYGWMPSTDPPTVAFAAAATLVYAGPGGAARRVGPAWLLLFFAVACDWAGGFAVASIACFELLSPRGERAWRKAFLTTTAAPAAALSYVTLVAWWEGGFGRAVAGFARIGGGVMAGGNSPDWATWAASQAEFFARLYTAPLLVVGVVAVVVSLTPRGRAEPASRLILPLFLPGLLNVVLFRHHAATHEFWSYHGMPAFVVAAGVLAAPRRARAAGPVVGLLVAFLAWRTVDLLRHYENDGWKTAAAEVDRLAGPDDLVLSNRYLGQSVAYVRAMTFRPLRSAEEIVFAVRCRRDGVLSARRTVFLIVEDGPGGVAASLRAALVEAGLKLEPRDDGTAIAIDG